MWRPCPLCYFQCPLEWWVHSRHPILCDCVMCVASVHAWMKALRNTYLSGLLSVGTWKELLAFGLTNFSSGSKGSGLRRKRMQGEEAQTPGLHSFSPMAPVFIKLKSRNYGDTLGLVYTLELSSSQDCQGILKYNFYSPTGR